MPCIKCRSIFPFFLILSPYPFFSLFNSTLPTFTHKSTPYTSLSTINHVQQHIECHRCLWWPRQDHHSPFHQKRAHLHPPGSNPGYPTDRWNSHCPSGPVHKRNPYQGHHKVLGSLPRPWSHLDLPRRQSFFPKPE